MRSSKARYIISAAIMAALLLSHLTYGANFDKPAKVLYLEAFTGMEAWKPFGLLSVEEPSTKASKNLPVLQLTDGAGRLVAVAQWGGEDAVISKDGREWSITLTAAVGLKKLRYSLKSVWSDDTKLPWGIAELTVAALDNPADAANYRHTLRLPGSGSWVSKDGKAAAVEAVSQAKDTIDYYLALSPLDGTCTFKSKQIEKADGKKETRKIFFVEATSVAPRQGEEPKALVMGIRLSMARAWSYEPVLDLAAAMSGAKADPDVRIFGTADKQAASPGDSLEYRYYLFNAGMDEAADLNVTIPISDKTSLIVASIYGSPGKARLMPSGEEVEVRAEKGDSKAVDVNIKSMHWKPSKNLMPGEMIYIAFSVII
ncbi:MAG TPA: hypothetical protein PLT03_00515 [Bacillota bacterium]|nr:hypothetical protein [Bacillota bacterium]HOG52335.1 hypothetical protein [Bacillota bacterium]